MINRTMIGQTGVDWSEDDSTYLPESLLFLPIIASAETAEAALAIFRDQLTRDWPTYGRQILDERKTRLRANTEFRGNVSMSTMNEIRALADRLGCDECEAIDYLVKYARVAVLPNSPGQDVSEPLVLRPWRSPS